MYFEMKNGLIIIEASINDQKGKFIFDTGLDGIIINGKANQKDQIFETIGGSMHAEEVNIKQLQVGNLIKTNIKAYQTDLSSVTNMLQTNISGMIGLSILNEMLISIDYDLQTLKLIPKVSHIDQVIAKKQSMKIVMQNDVPCIYLYHKGKSLLFALDTGAGNHFFDNSTLNLPIKKGESRDIISVGGKYKTEDSTSLSLTNENNFILALSFSLIDLTSINQQLDQPINGILSAKTLFKTQIFIDPASNLLFY
jgi:hypothetical protein